MRQILREGSPTHDARLLGRNVASRIKLRPGGDRPALWGPVARPPVYTGHTAHPLPILQYGEVASSFTFCVASAFFFSFVFYRFLAPASRMTFTAFYPSVTATGSLPFSPLS